MLDGGKAEVDPTKVFVNATMKGLAGYRIKKYASDRDISVSVAAKEIMVEGLKALSLVHKEYTLNDMSQGK